MPRFVQVFLPTLGQFKLGLQLASRLSSNQYSLVLLRVDIHGFFLGRSTTTVRCMADGLPGNGVHVTSSVEPTDLCGIPLEERLHIHCSHAGETPADKFVGTHAQRTETRACKESTERTRAQPHTHTHTHVGSIPTTLTDPRTRRSPPSAGVCRDAAP